MVLCPLVRIKVKECHSDSPSNLRFLHLSDCIDSTSAEEQANCQKMAPYSSGGVAAFGKGPSIGLRGIIWSRIAAW
jgi:hypothetical protein